MDSLKETMAYLHHYRSDIKAVLSIANSDAYSPLVDGFDRLYLAITEGEISVSNNHYAIDPNVRIQFRSIGRGDFEQWVLSGSDRRIIQWLIEGEIVYDPDEYLSRYRLELVSFPSSLRQKKVLMEFAHFLSRYLQAKQYLHQDQLLDAYSNVLHALHHWARLAIIESSTHPEITVWSQVRHINPGVYKLYDELANGKDSLQARIELVLLACEFSVMSKMEQSCSFLLQILKSSKDGWSVQQLHEHPELRDLQVDLSLLLKKLVKKGLVQEKSDDSAARVNEMYPIQYV